MKRLTIYEVMYILEVKKGVYALNSETVEKILRELLEETKLLTVKTKAESLRKFNNEFLTSDLRKTMYAAFDGVRTLPQISNDIGCKVNTLQIFAQQLIDKDLVDYEIQGKAKIISKSLSKIAVYYTNAELEEA